MKKNMFRSLMIIVGVLFLSTAVYANKFDKLFPEKDKQLISKAYNESIASNTIIMDYLDTIIGSPSGFYKKLKKQDCNKELLSYIKDNKQFMFKLFRMRIVMILSKINGGGDDSQLIFVTNYAKGEKPLAAKNSQQMGTETAFMRQMPSFLIYELYTKPDGLKEQVEEVFAKHLK